MTHDDFHNLTHAYLAGGLADEERAAMAAHAAGCPACAAWLEQAQAADRELQDAFAADVPDDRLEDRVIAALRDARPPRLIVHPMVRRAAVGVAAAILLGGVGFAITSGERDARRIADASRLKQLGLATQPYANENRGRLPALVREGEVSHAATTQPNTNFLAYPTNWPVVSERRESKPDSNQLHYWWDVDHDFVGTPLYDRFDSEVKPDFDDVSGKATELKLGVTRFSTAGGVQGAAGKPTGTEADAKKLAEQEFRLGKKLSAAKQPAEVRFKPNVAFGVTPLFRDAGTPVEGLQQLGRSEGRTWAESEGVLGGQASGNGRGRVGNQENGKVALSESLATANGTLQIGGQGQGQGQQPVSAASSGTIVLQDGFVRQFAFNDGHENGPKPADQPAAGQDATPKAPPPQNPKPETPPKAESPKPDDSALAGRKIIRNGEMTFEVDGYDSAVVQITKIAAEEGGFVATTESEKLPNGKVKGSVVVRVPPERLDTLVLKLRGLGDLKNSRISAQDITKQYTDLDAQLRAAKTMEQRLLEIVKSGKGEVKDLIEAEKQLGNWREKIEKLEGEIRYYNNLVALSTLTVTLAERDVRAASLLSETEQVQMGVEADDVEKARAGALKAIEEAKGRVIASDLKKHDAGQFAATITADLAPDQAGPVIDRLKQLGRVARLEAQRQQRTAEGSGTPIPGARVERKDTRLVLSIYNLANVAPRNTTTMQLAAEDVESAYRAILAQIDSAGGRVVNSQLTKPTPEQTSGTVAFESPAAAADVLLGAVRGAGDVLRLDTTINPDTDNTTAAKRGFNVTIQAAATVAPAENVSLRLAVDDVQARFDKLLGALRGVKGARVTQSSVTQQTPTTTVGQIEVDVRGDEPRKAVERALADAGAVYLRSVAHTSPGRTMLADKSHVSVLLGDVNAIPVRETTTINVETADVTGAAGQIEAAAIAAGGRKVDSDWSQQPGGQTVARIVVEVPQAKAAELIKGATDARRVLSIQREQTPNVPEGPFARSRVSVSFSTTEAIQGDQTLGGSVRSGLATSVQWLLRSVTWIVIGLCLVAPWAVVIWAIVRIVKRRRRATTPESPTPPAAPSAAASAT